MNKALLFPGSFQMVKNYFGYDGVDIWLKGADTNILPADCFVEHSLGANFILENYPFLGAAVFVFVNPLVRKRNFVFLFLSWIAFLLFEGIRGEKLTPVEHWRYGIGVIWRLLRVDAWGKIKSIPPEHLVVIRGQRDRYFCDTLSSEAMRKQGIRVIEVDAGHDWNEKIAGVVRQEIARLQKDTRIG